MKKYYIYIKKYFPFVLLVLVGVIVFSTSISKKPTSKGTPAQYSTEKQKFVEAIPVDSSIGKNVAEVEETTPELEVKATEPLGAGLNLTRYSDTKNETAVQLISDETGKVLAMIRTPVSETERNVDSFMKSAGLGTPAGVMYPTRSSIGTVYVYPDSGVAFVFNEASRGVYYVINFEIMSLIRFKQVFSTLYQDTPDEKAY